MSEINIKKSNRGKFTESAKRAGMGVQEYARHVLANKDNYDTTTVRRANFARNFGGASHKKAKKYSTGGKLHYYYTINPYKLNNKYAGLDDMGNPGNNGSWIGSMIDNVKSYFTKNPTEAKAEYETIPAVYDRVLRRLRPMNENELENYNTYGHPDGRWSKNVNYDDTLNTNIRNMFGFTPGRRISQVLPALWDIGMKHNMSPNQISALMAMVMNELPDNFNESDMKMRNHPIYEYKKDANGNFAVDENGKRITLPWNGKMERTSGPFQFSETYYVDPNDRTHIVKQPNSNSSLRQYSNWLTDNNLDPSIENAIEYYLSTYIPNKFDEYYNRNKNADYGRYGEENIDVKSLWENPSTDVGTLADIASHVFQRSASMNVPEYIDKNTERSNKLSDLYSQLYTTHSANEPYDMTIRIPKENAYGGSLSNQFNYGGYIPLDGVVQLPPQYDGESDIPVVESQQTVVPVSGGGFLLNNLRSSLQAMPTRGELMDRISENIYPRSKRPIRVKNKKAAEVPQLTLPLNIGGNIVYGVGPMPEWYNYEQNVESRNPHDNGGNLNVNKSLKNGVNKKSKSDKNNVVVQKPITNDGTLITVPSPLLPYAPSDSLPLPVQMPTYPGATNIYDPGFIYGGNPVGNINQNDTTQIFYPRAGMLSCGGKLRADGGDLGRSNGAYWPSGLTYVESGGTHEENPNQGVLMGTDSEGTPNLVEEGEVIYNDYVFSNRLHPTKDDLKTANLPLKYQKSTFAKIAEDMGKEIRGRENDPISRRGLSANLSTLAVMQEAQRTRNGKNGTQMLQGQEPMYPEPETEGQFKSGGNKSKNRYKMSLNGSDINFRSPMSFVNGIGRGLRFSPAFLGKAGRIVSRPYILGNSIYNALNYQPVSIPMPVFESNVVTPQLGYINPDLSYDSLAFAPSYPTVRFNADGGILPIGGEAKKKVDANIYKGNESHTNLDSSNIDRYETVDTSLPWNFWMGPMFRNGFRHIGDFFSEPINAIKELYTTTGIPTKDENGNKINLYKLRNTDLGNEPTEYTGKGRWSPQQLFVKVNPKSNDNSTITANKNYPEPDEIAPAVVIPDRNQQIPQSPAVPSVGGGVQGSVNVPEIKSVNVPEIKSVNIPDIDLQPYTDEDIDLDSINALTPEEEADIDRATAESVAAAQRYVNGLSGGSEEDEFTPLDTSLRYAPVVGSAISALSNILQKPDYSNSDILARAANSLPHSRVRARAINNYLPYNPLDRNYYLNQLRAQAGATRRAVNGSNAGNAMAQNLAAGYNAQNAVGQNLMQQEQYNNQLMQQIGSFNRATDQYNSQQAMTADQANAQMELQRAQARMNALATVAQMRENVDDGLAQARSEALSQLFDNLGGVGRQNFNYNQAMSNKASRYGSENGTAYYKRAGSDDTALSDNDILAQILENNGWTVQRPKACGGSLRKGARKTRQQVKK